MGIWGIWYVVKVRFCILGGGVLDFLVCFWVNCVVFWNFSFFSYKMRVIIKVFFMGMKRVLGKLGMFFGGGGGFEEG